MASHSDLFYTTNPCSDEEARRILDIAIPSPTVASPFQNSDQQSMSVSVALVLIVSLISVALLITGIPCSYVQLYITFQVSSSLPSP